MYKITEASHADAMIRAVKRGVPVRLIVEPSFYRDKSNVWQAYQVDRLYSAGVQIRVRAHQGFTHQKTVLLYGQAMSHHRIVELDLGLEQGAARTQLLHDEELDVFLAQGQLHPQVDELDRQR